MNPRVIEVRAGSPYRVEDAAVFAQVSVDREAGTIVWPNGADLDPDVLFEAAHATRTAAGE